MLVQNRKEIAMKMEELKDMNNTAFWGIALGVKALLDMAEKEGYCADEVLWLAQVWRDQDPYVHAADCAVALNARHACSCGQNPTGQGMTHETGKEASRGR
jgi:hypothetical protein